MATTTARLGLRKPASSDSVNVGTDLDNNFDAIDNVIGFTACTSTTRPSTPFQGQVIYETDTKRSLVCNGSSPASGSWEQNPFTGFLPVTSTTRPTSVFPGLVIRESDTGSYYLSNGSSPASASWVSVPSTEGPVTVGYTGSTAPLRYQTTYSTTTANRLLDGRKAGDVNPAYTLDFDGKMQWGPGGGTASDTNLYRGSAGVLQTDSALVVAGHGLAQTFEGLATSDLTIPATTPADVPGATVTFTTVRPNATAVVTCNFDWRLTALGTGYCYGTLVVDGTAQREALFVAQSAETRAPGSFGKRVVLASAGSHTIKLQGRKDTASGTAFFAGGGITGVEVTLYD